MLKPIAVLLIALLSIWGVYSLTTIRDQRDQIRVLQAKLDDKSKRDQIELEEKCAAQADKVFRELGYSQSKDHLQSHYNVANAKFRFLLDAYEERDYASFNQLLGNGNRSTVFCTLTPPNSKAPNCRSNDEYDAFIHQYLE